MPMEGDRLSMAHRKTYIDVAKGIGILLVIFGHSAPSYEAFIAWQCSFFMALFFVCSGLCYKSPKSFRENAKKILTPYYFWGALGLCFELALLILQKKFAPMLLLDKTLKLLLGMNMWNYPLWFLVAFFVSKCVFDWIFSVTEKRKHKNVFFLIATAICFVLGLALAQVKKTCGFFLPFRLDIGLTMLPFFVIGYASRQIMENTEIKNRGYTAAIMLLLLAVNYVAYKMNCLVSVNSSDYGNPIWFLLSSVSGSYFVLLLGQFLCMFRPAKKALAWFGVNSMTIMCVHALVLVFIAKAVVVLNGYLHLGRTVLDLLKFLLCTICMIPVCVVLKWKKRQKKRVW